MIKWLFSKKHIILCFAAIVLFFVIGAVYVYATSLFYNVDQGQIVRIDEHGICKFVRRNDPGKIFVPTKTEYEWTTFINNAIGVTIMDCWQVGPCAGIEVFTTDFLPDQQWKTSMTDCNTPQCSLDGGQNDDLAVDNGADFTEYPARDACKSLGGRLPTRDELSCIHSNKTFYTGFIHDRYWSSTELNTNDAWAQAFNPSMVGGINAKNLVNSVRCVR